MSPLLMDDRIYTPNYVNKPSHRRSHVLKSRENISKLKCNKSLKKKLKKYKLRKDGKEDPDIIDVSHNLIKSLRIKSPITRHFLFHKVSEESKPHNYLTKMVRLKKTVIGMESTQPKVKKCNSDITTLSTSMISKSEEDKKQTDAFKLLMDSRNKSIGSNSPGKEKCDEDSVVQERLESKELRAKRILSLNRMAQAKGSLQKLEIEEYREENIRKKMEERTKKFKNMIVNGKGKNGKKDSTKSSINEELEKSDKPIILHVAENRDILDINTPVLKTFDLFNDTKVNQNGNMKEISKDDEEFLKKLSPSIRKKENMLCYFHKVNKGSDLLQDDNNTVSHNGDQLILKVKPKSRNKLSKKKNESSTVDVVQLSENYEHNPKIINQELQTNTLDSNKSIKKRKRTGINKPVYEETTNRDINGTIPCLNDSRPKRNTKKPVKYTDNFEVISSDEEFHIFTPKKKRKEKLALNTEEHTMVQSCKISDNVVNTKQKKSRDMKKNPPKNEDHSLIPKKVTKLAPIFVSKPLLDSAAIEAKQKFLQSGVPSQLKKTSTGQTSTLASDEFQKVVHVQNLDYMYTPITSNILNVTKINYNEIINLKEERDPFKKLLQVPMLQNYGMPKFQKNANQILHDIKLTYPKFPVYRTYHLLMGKCKGEFKDCIYPDLDNSAEIFNNMIDINNIQPDKLNWVDKYKPSTEKQLIGNFEGIKELRRWLVTWTENDAKSKKIECRSDSSDFYQSDIDSKEAIKNENNLLIITGKVGTGKTLSVYAVAAELAIKVIEVNASAKRTGKIMLQDLQEATQSHKVDRAKNNTDLSQKSEELFATNTSLVKKKRGRKKKVEVDSVTNSINTTKEPTELTVSQDNVRTGMSLILIDDADIVFDQDDGFCYAISQLIQSSKRPVILVTSSLTCPHLQKFTSLAKIIKMQPFLPRMLGTWLDIVCLVDNNMCSPGLGAKTLDLFKGDIRRTINYLHFFTTSHKYLNNMDNPCLFKNEEVSKVNTDDENSCMSWGDKEDWADTNMGLSHSSNICKYLIHKESQLLHFLGPLNHFYLWWNLPKLLNYNQSHSDHTFQNLGAKCKIKEAEELNKIATVFDSVSITDYLGTYSGEEPNITSGPWQCFEKDSVIDNENFAPYDRNYDFIKEISWELMIKGIAETQRDIGIECNTEMNYPSMSIQRERNRVVSRHKTLTDCLNPSTALDRRALALDYWSSCRNICRIEKSKTSNNGKRNNRFCHYLKSLNIVCKNEYFDNLGDSLSFKK